MTVGSESLAPLTGMNEPEQAAGPTVARGAGSASDAASQALAHLVAVFLQTRGQNPRHEAVLQQLRLQAHEPWPQRMGAVLQALGMDVKVRREHRLKPGQTLLRCDADGGVALVGLRPDGSCMVQRADADAPQTLSLAELATQSGGLAGAKGSGQGASVFWLEANVAPQASAGASGVWADDAKGAHGRPSAREVQPSFGMAWIWRAVKKQRQLVTEVLVASVALQLFALVSPLIFQVVIDKVLANRTLSTLDVLVFAMVCIAIFETVLSILRQYLVAHAGARIDSHLGSSVFERLMRLPLSYFDSRQSSVTMARLKEMETARSFFTSQAPTALIDGIFLFVFIAVMWIYSPVLTGLVLLSLPIVFLVSFYSAPMLRKKLEDRFEANAKSHGFLMETVGSMETVKASNAQAQLKARWNAHTQENLRASLDGSQVSSVSQGAVGLISKLLTATLLWWGAKLVLDGQLTVGALIAFNMLASRVSVPMMRLANLWQEIQQVKLAVKRVGDIMQAPVEPQSAQATSPSLRGAIAFKDVSFKHQADGPEVLSRVSFAIEPGQKVGIVGASGAGKTTLVRLLQGLYPPSQGQILIDGQDLALMDLPSLRAQLGVVPQDAVIYDASLRDNVCLGLSAVDEAAFGRALQQSGVDRFLPGLSKGVDTVLGERGASLSGGQRSRVLLARALVREPRVLILDEATAALDSITERDVQRQMLTALEGKTALIVAHRLSTLRRCDLILVLDGGGVRELGSHEALLAQRGMYFELYNSQERDDV
jgi:ATP-binding cassette, subfamily B, bacterial HlyB/CyaB